MKKRLFGILGKSTLATLLAGAVIAFSSPVAALAAGRGGAGHASGGRSFAGSARGFSGGGRAVYGGAHRGGGYYGGAGYRGFGVPYAYPYYGYAPVPAPCGFYDQAGYWHPAPCSVGALPY